MGPPEGGFATDINLPFHDLKPFGREDTANELTDDSMKQTDNMVDQIEKAEVAEEKRAIFRARTHLRSEAINNFDGIARAQAANVDEYAASNPWRSHHKAEALGRQGRLARRLGIQAPRRLASS
ncbi:unnamed protein product [Vitrella brassicaformis CCMP3155]|uniref:Clathrin light chain n=2 Tax=Vitrella brassicaformis TaxID=1169539 RepID=A0A0G4H3P7_VITBC|nr:unnamed protein product [Vitrella brassicaformis CCMP3155]|eukprot:CEM38353.1 unnamed protein product [Vitrella brassicaformis CCMP3155]